MKTVAILALASAMGGIGCASTGTGAQLDVRGWSGIAWHGEAAVQVGESRVIDARVDPLAPVGMTSGGGTIDVSYERVGRVRSVERIDAGSLARTSSDADRPVNVAAAGPTGDARVVLEGGRFVMVWKRGTLEWGHRAMAQEFNADGSSRGAPVVISPPDVDVVGSLQALTTDGRHVVVTFAESSAKGFKLVAVPIEPEVAGGDSDRFARK
jgi:hypothetical protein